MCGRQLKTLLAGDAGEIERLVTRDGHAWTMICVLIIAISCGIYGFSFGLWRGEVQALSTALKFPLVIFATCAGNALINGLLGLVMGTGLTMRQSSIAILSSFAAIGLILAALTPLMLFLLWNVPAFESGNAAIGQNITLLSHVVVIAIAGCIGNVRLAQVLLRLTGSRANACAILFSWLATNLLLGSQVAWMLRPWIGKPGVPITFFSASPLEGNFFEAVWKSLLQLVTHL